VVSDNNAAQHHVSVYAADCAQISSTIKIFIKTCQENSSFSFVVNCLYFVYNQVEQIYSAVWCACCSLIVLTCPCLSSVIYVYDRA